MRAATASCDEAAAVIHPPPLRSIETEKRNVRLDLERTHAADSQLLTLESLEMSAPLRRWIWFAGLYVISIVALGAVTFSFV
jgi:hypothetical protein